jgi:hypothetical protein
MPRGAAPVELIRGLTTGILSAGMLWHVLYYVVMIAVGLVFTTKRLRALFLDPAGVHRDRVEGRGEEEHREHHEVDPVHLLERLHVARDSMRCCGGSPTPPAS